MTVAGALLLGLGLAGVLTVYLPDIEYGIGTLVERDPLPALAVETSAASAPGAITHAGTRVRLPRVGIDVSVGGGTARVREEVLLVGAWWHAGTPEPGRGSGNTVLAGHRVRRLFAKLAHVRPGDEVVVDWNARRYRYRVERVFTVAPEDTSILDQNGEERLTLYTCLPRAFGNKRRVVVATPVR